MSLLLLLLIITIIINIIIMLVIGLCEDAGKGEGLSPQPGVGAVVRRLRGTERQHSALDGHALQIPICTQNAASTSCDKLLHVKEK